MAAMRSIIRPASPAPETRGRRSSDSAGDSSTMRSKSVWACRPSAWASTSSAAGMMSGTRSIRARRCGVVCVNSTTRKRSSPWTTRRIVPSDCLSIRWIIAIVPVRCSSWGAGVSCAASCWVRTPISRWPRTASSTARTDDGRATASGMTACGKSTDSRSGRMASSSGVLGVRAHGVRRARAGRARLDPDVGVAHCASSLRIRRRSDGCAVGHTVSSGIARPRAPPASARDWSRSHISWHRVQRTAKGWARSRAGCDLLLARLAAPVASFVHLLQGQIHLREHAGPPVGHRKAHLVVGRQGGAVAERHALDLLAARRRLDAALALLPELGHEVGALLQEQRLQLRLHVGGSLGRS